MRNVRSESLGALERATLRGLLDRAFECGFRDADWAHALGGIHVLGEIDGRLVAHASVVARTLELDDRPVRTGYVEAVATDPDHQGRGIGSSVMSAIGDVVRDGFELGALSTGRQRFYRRLGWERWLGPTFVRGRSGRVRTPDDDGGLLVLRTGATGPLDVTGSITCDWRPGDVW